MKLAFAEPNEILSDWREALHVAFSHGHPSVFDFEWLIDRAERGEWSGVWW